MTTLETFLEEECCDVYWKIRNFSYCWESISSSHFSFVDDRSYCIKLTPKLSEIEFGLKCTTKYSYDINNFQVTFLTFDGSPEESFSVQQTYDNLKVPKDLVFGKRRSSFLPEDTLTVRIRWPTGCDKGKLFIFSQIAVKRQYFLWTFSSLSAYSYTVKKIIEKSNLYGDIELSLKTMGGMNSAEQFNTNIHRTGGEKCYCILKVSVLDLEGKSINEVSDEFIFEKSKIQQVRGFPSIVKMSKWLECKNLLLKEDELSLKCFFAITTGTVTDQTADISYCEYAAPLLKQSELLLVTFQETEDSSSVLELQSDLKNLMQDGTLTDLKLQIGTNEIEAHKNILSARSPVFKAMFTKDMKEKNTNTVVIEDLDVDTVRRLLLYMYTDTIHLDQWENIKNLYIAANKYGVLSLKQKCASFLKTNLSVSKVIEALMLADLHEDGDLKAIVLDFISEFDTAVFDSEEWKELERNNPSLAIQIMRDIFINKRIQ